MIDHNRIGTAYGLTVFTPIVPGHEEAVRDTIERLPRGEDGPFSRLEQLHFARLQIFDQLVHQGPSQRPDRLRDAYLVFTASFNGARDEFLDAVAVRMPVEADSWWSHCVAYPGAADPRGLHALPEAQPGADPPVLEPVPDRDGPRHS